MRVSLRKISGPLLLLAAMLLPFPSAAQEDESGGADEGWGKLIFEYGTWAAEADGIGNHFATVVDPANSFNDTIVGFGASSEAEDYVRFGAELAGNRGRLLITWYAHDSAGQAGLRDPGNFIFGEILALPVYAGLSNDGFADAVDAGFASGLRDQKIDYSRVAFSSARLEGRWSVGYRAVTYRQSVDATYYALVPTFPAFVPPLTTGLPDLTPLPDLVYLQSDYEGRGIGGGFEFTAPLYRDTLTLEASLGISLLRGDVDTQYRSVNHFYAAGSEVLEAPYDELFDYTVDPISGLLTGFAATVTQVAAEAGLRAHSLPRNSQVLELNIGGRWRATSFMNVFFGFRTISYSDVAVHLRPQNIVVIGDTINSVDASETNRSATYEGFYGGLGFQF